MSDFDIGNFPVPRLLTIVADLLTSMCITNDRIPSTHLSVFDSRAVPPILITDYMTRILKYTPYSNQVLLCMLIYFDRIAENQENTITLHSHNIHRFIIAGIVIATKSTSDIYYKNARYAKVGGITVEELNHLEWAFLKLCDFRVHVALDELQQYANQIWQLALSKRQQQRQQQQQQQDIIIPNTIATNTTISPSSPAPVQFPVTTSHPSASSMSLPLTPPYDGTAITTTATNIANTGRTTCVTKPFLSPTDEQHHQPHPLRVASAAEPVTSSSSSLKSSTTRQGRRPLRSHPYRHTTISR
ncbi:cyclin-domain-containing protein [Absidia repens]|uniref:Cyclin-domain-containing protein n=1 Tax=Absidia repens TaxID=90262 RepID=A0A1X2IEQ0_9FUNG|nr:cyclin-domain-containing protein [Absidia repens]